MRRWSRLSRKDCTWGRERSGSLRNESLSETGSGRKIVGPIYSRDFTDTKRPIMTSLDVKMAFDAAKPAVVSKILTLTGVHGACGGSFVGRGAGCSRFGMLR